MTNRRISILAALSLLGSAGLAQAGSESVVVEYAEKAMAKGYGSTCSLAMEPVDGGGYYPCLDFGPYRYVRGYGQVGGFVVQKGRAPFKVMGGSSNRPEFLFAGPWEQDMAIKVVEFWNDTVSGGARRAAEMRDADGRKTAAEEYINSLNKRQEPVKPPAGNDTGKEPASGQEPADSARGVFTDEIGKPVKGEDLKEVLGTVTK